MEPDRTDSLPSIDQIIARVGAEAESRRAMAPSVAAQRTPWTALKSRLDAGPDCATEFRRRVGRTPAFKTNESRTYAMGDFLGLHGGDFIEACYLALLGRAPDPTGFQAFLTTMLAGMRKAEIIARIRLSPEGRAYGAKVRGLAPQAAVVALFRVPVIGYVAECALSILTLPGIARGLRAAAENEAFQRQRILEEVERALRRAEGEASRSPR